MGGRLGGGLSREDFHEFRVGRIKHERVKVKQIYFRERRSFIEIGLIDRMFLSTYVLASSKSSLPCESLLCFIINKNQ